MLNAGQVAVGTTDPNQMVETEVTMEGVPMMVLEVLIVVVDWQTLIEVIILAVVVSAVVLFILLAVSLVTCILLCNCVCERIQTMVCNGNYDIFQQPI